MTNGLIDIKNTDMMLIMGGNPAENHPCGFKWPIEAKLQRNAKMIVVDPRFTRTAASADLFLQIRAGADIAFLGGLINYAIENGRIAHDYVVNYTNAAFIVKEGFKLPDDGLYSGFDPSTQLYDKSFQEYKLVYDRYPDSGRVGEAVAKMANYYYQQKDYARAIDVFESVLKSQPDAKYLDVILFNYGRCLYRMDRKAEARKRFDQLIGDYPESPLAGDAKKISEALNKAERPSTPKAN